MEGCQIACEVVCPLCDCCCLVCRPCPLQPTTVLLLLQGIAIGGVPSLHRSRRKKGGVPLRAPVVGGGKVERARGVMVASLATEFSHRAKWCPLTSSQPYRILPRCPLLAVSSAVVRSESGRMKVAPGDAIRFSISAMLLPSLQPGMRFENRARCRQIWRPRLLQPATVVRCFVRLPDIERGGGLPLHCSLAKSQQGHGELEGCVPPLRDLPWRLWL